MLTAGGLGMAAVGGAGVVNDLLDGSGVKGLGLLPPGTPLLRIAGTPAADVDRVDLAQIKVS